MKSFERGLQEVKERSPRMVFDDWAIDNGFKVQKKEFIYTLDPSEDVDESNWREKGWFRKYDARDELHRSPEKLKMIERMEQFPHEDWGQEELPPIKAKKLLQEPDSDISEAATSDSSDRDPQIEASNGEM